MSMKPKKRNSIAVALPSSSSVTAERKVFTDEFKQAAVERMKQGDIGVTALACELGIRRNQLYKWEKILEGRIPGEPVRGRWRLPAAEEGCVPGSGVRSWRRVRCRDMTQ
jgi:transposase